MELLKKMMCVLTFVAIISACSSGENNTEEQEIEIKAKPLEVDWSKAKDQVLYAIDKHYVDNTLRQSMLQYQFRDNVKGKVIFFSLGAIQKDSIYPLSGTRAFMRVDGRTEKGDNLIFDYEVKATPSPEKADSMVYNVESLSLRKVNNEQRYNLKKEGNFWIKEILAIAQ